MARSAYGDENGSPEVTALPGVLGACFILRVARLNGADYEYQAHVPDTGFGALHEHITARGIAAPIATVGDYNLVSRFFETLSVNLGLRMGTAQRLTRGTVCHAQCRE